MSTPTFQAPLALLNSMVEAYRVERAGQAEFGGMRGDVTWAEHANDVAQGFAAPLADSPLKALLLIPGKLQEASDALYAYEAAVAAQIASDAASAAAVATAAANVTNFGN